MRALTRDLGGDTSDFATLLTLRWGLIVATSTSEFLIGRDGGVGRDPPTWRGNFPPGKSAMGRRTIEKDLR